MIKYIKLLQKRPSNTTLTLWRMLFSMIFIGSLYYNLIEQWDTIDTNFFWVDIPPAYIIYIKYSFIALWVIPLLLWASNICLLKKKWVKIIQIIFWITLFYISSKIIPLDPNALDVDTLIFIMWFFPLFCGITWKCISSKCLKFGEKITKIRV